MTSIISETYGLPIIGDDFVPEPADENTIGRGRIPRDWDRHPYGATEGLTAFDLPLIDRAEWPDRIADLEAYKADLHSRCQAAGYTVASQGQTSSCWMNAIKAAAEVLRIKMGLEPRRLSSGSLVARVTNFRDRGGWAVDGVRAAGRIGFCLDSTWPNTLITSNRYDTPESDAERANYRIPEWWEAPGRRFDILATMLLSAIPSAMGLNWASHEVLGVKLLKLDGADRYGVLTYNSGYLRDANGYTIFRESRATPDDLVAPRTTTMS